MSMLLSPGLFVLAYAIAVSAWLVALTLRFARRREFLIEAMVQYAFLPEKRRRYMAFLSLEGAFFLLSGLTWGLTDLGVLTDAVGDLTLGVFLVLGMTAIAALTWVGLRPSNLSAADRAELQTRAPAFLYSLAMVPIQDPADDPRL
jgi:uncharacterized membrane protein